MMGHLLKLSSYIFIINHVKHIPRMLENEVCKHSAPIFLIFFVFTLQVLHYSCNITSVCLQAVFRAVRPAGGTMAGGGTMSFPTLSEEELLNLCCELSGAEVPITLASLRNPTMGTSTLPARTHLLCVRECCPSFADGRRVCGLTSIGCFVPESTIQIFRFFVSDVLNCDADTATVVSQMAGVESPGACESLGSVLTVARESQLTRKYRRCRRTIQKCCLMHAA